MGQALAVPFGQSFYGATTFSQPTTRGPMDPSAGQVYARQRLSTDSIGTFTLTLTGLVIGSAIQIETQAGALVENRTAGATTEVFSVPAYVAGNASNDLRIKVRKGSAAPFYRPYETLATAFVGSASVFVSQIPDE